MKKKNLLTQLARLSGTIRFLDNFVTNHRRILKFTKSKVAICRQDYAKKLQIIEALRHILHTVDSSDLSEPEKSTFFKEIGDCIKKIWQNVLG